ncbi:MAG: sulfite exporter TauE/SafE family protein [Kiritimatiellae bacterium]|nr:sulfite exporter TauE/SafE family protein [Kiritimatiellia bacterium]
MSELITALVSALWLGILTSISPCPLATNVAAISFVARRVSRPSKVLLAGLLYTAGRSVTYVIVGGLLTAGLLSAPYLSQMLEKYMNKLLGPFLIVVGMILLDLVRFTPSGGGMSEKMQRRVELLGLWGALLLGIVFAASFCPISGALFFGTVLSAAVRVRSAVLVPTVFGLGTGLPVLVFAVLIAGGAKRVGAAYNRIAAFEKWARRITGGLFVGVGVYYSLRYVFGV